ncbi:hypothetical protein RHSIM_Rhsim01G0157800 [Rhododendron simsii]|uniref:SWIM-type domain-containing protein n=1 Tax=Rhododendron simsii TaxID=118357 RepID=A0A834M0P4_RHOSS|nr:hypothetical protein RHSIM_Rhsim01G0157800 [Rhododendron simsii]
MEKSLILFCKYNGLCAGIKLSRSLRIGDFLKILCGKFSELRKHSLQLFYAIRDHPSTMLYNDEDLEVIRGFDSGTNGCGGDVGANISGGFDSGGDVGAGTSKGISFNRQGLVSRLLESMGYVGKEDDLGAMFCPHQQRPRLSDAWKELIKSVGQLFVGGSKGFRDALRKYSIVHSFEFDFVKNETERVTAVCKVKSCQWNIHARLDKVSGCFYIKRYYNVHSCVVVGRTTKNCHANSTLISQLIKDDVRDKSKKRPVDVVDDLKEYYGVDLKMVMQGNLRTALASTNVKYKESLIRVFLKCAYAPTVAKFNQHMELELHVVDMVDRIRKKMMTSMCLRRERASKWEQVICPYGESRLEKLYDLVKTWKVIPSSADIFEVDTDPFVSVDIERHTCSCCWWQLNGFPCCHAVCVIKYSGKDLNLYVERYFHVESYCQVYSKPIYPVASLWKGDVVDCGTSILPPLSKKPPGRPKKKRIRSNREKVREMKCGRCGKMGNHNKLVRRI